MHYITVGVRGAGAEEPAPSVFRRLGDRSQLRKS